MPDAATDTTAEHDRAGVLRFADLGRTGARGGWWYALSLPLIAVTVVAVTVLAALVLGAVNPTALGLVDARGALWRVADISTVIAAAAFILLTIGAALPATLAIAAPIHGRPWRSFITARPAFAWGRFATSFAAWAALSAAALGVTVAASPNDVALAFRAERWLAFLPVALVCLLVQVAAEEVFFRGYLLQAIGHATRLNAVRLIAPAVLFTAVHIPNSDFQAGGLLTVAAFAIFSLYLGWLALTADGLEDAIAVHYANNIFALVIIANAKADIAVPSVLVHRAPVYALDLALTVAVCAAHWGILRLVRRR